MGQHEVPACRLLTMALLDTAQKALGVNCSLLQANDKVLKQQHIYTSSMHTHPKALY